MKLLSRKFMVNNMMTHAQLAALVLLRVLIGWHFLYEGLVKVFNPYWTSAGFLMESKWILSGLFSAIVANPAALKIVDTMNAWGLIFIGFGLILGCLTRIAGYAGIALLALYYAAAPPFIGMSYSIPFEGSYLIVNKNLIELCALIVLMLFPTGTIIGLDKMVLMRKNVNNPTQTNVDLSGYEND
jgi:thiosulfate dehydrogenase (quinone) large subunit